MLIRIVTKAPRGSRKGNRVSAERWATLLREQGHRVVVTTDATPRRADLLVALHARHAATAVRRFAKAFPDTPILLALTGTDLYLDVPRGHAATLASMQRADRLLVLQPDALHQLPEALAAKARVVPQSVPRVARPPASRRRQFDICVAGHFRHVKDPLRAALASRRLPATSRIAVLQAGGVIEPRFHALIEREQAANPRFSWLGELSRAATLRLIARSRGLVISSRAEGGAHVVGEALVNGTPILASNISGNIGMLGADYPALFEVGDTQALARLMLELERNSTFRNHLTAWCTQLAPAYHPQREREALQDLIAELS